jgi:hypothetical protein
MRRYQLKRDGISKLEGKLCPRRGGAQSIGCSSSTRGGAQTATISRKGGAQAATNSRKGGALAVTNN